MFSWTAVLVLVWMHLETGDGRSLTDGHKKQATCHKKIDLGIILDASASTGKETFKEYKQFAKQLLNRFDLSPAATHIALSYFSQYHHKVATFDKSYTLKEADSIIDNMFYEQSVTRLANVMMDLNFAVFAGNSSGVRPKGSGSKMAAILLTDGFSTTGYENTKFHAENLHRYGVETFAVHPNGRLHKKSLHSIASKPIPKHLFRLAGSREKKDSQIDQIVRQICFGSYSKQ